jgi:hypothetical protein
LTTPGHEIVQAGRVARKELATLAQRGGEIGDINFDQIKTRLDWLEHAICTITFGISPPQLETTLPRCLATSRRGVVDLLDVLAEHAYDWPDTLPSKLGTLDYLITLLCTGGDTQRRSPPDDPALLSPRLQALCLRAQGECGARHPEVEAEFFAAANLAADLEDEIQLGRLRARKAELGRSYFVPGMLRAIVTYNVALQQCDASELWDSRDWGSDTNGDFAEDIKDHPASVESVFESETLHAIHQSLLRRIAGGPAESTPIGRIAWGLDLAYTDSQERAMLAEGTISPTCLRTSIVTVGLLSKSLNVLAIELQKIGADPDTLMCHWVKELDELHRKAVSASIAAGDAYGETVKLSELRNKFLYAQMREIQKVNRSTAPQNAAPPSQAEERKIRKEAHALASEALSDDGSRRPLARVDREQETWRDLQWRLIAPASAAVLLALTLGLHQLGWIDLLDRHLHRFAVSELVSVSPHLAKGHRNGDGAGAAFVGTVDDAWLSLPSKERQAAAEKLVARLRAQGVEQVMIYDGQRKLRIQALGDRVRML